MKRLGWICLLLLILASSAMAFETEEKVQSVRVELLLPPGRSLYPDLQERISLSFKSVAEKVLVGQRITTVGTLSRTFTGTIQKVFDMVLRGFEIEKLELAPGAETVLKITLVPQEPLIGEAKLKIAATGLAPGLLQFLEENEPLFSQVATEVLAGVPVAALDWAEGVMLGVLEQVVSTQLPGFGVHLDLKVGATTQIVLHLTPQGPVVRSLAVRVSSSTLPATLTQLFTSHAESQAHSLGGIPLAFLSHYKEQIQDSFARELNNHPTMRKWGLISSLGLEPGEVTAVKLTLDSRYLRLGLGLSLNIGTSAPSPALLTHYGFLWGRQEVFLENALALTTLSGSWQLGTSWQVAPQTRVTSLLQLADRQLQFRFVHSFQQYSVGLVSNFNQGLLELSMGTQTNNLSVELVGDLEQNYWLRLTAQI